MKVLDQALNSDGPAITIVDPELPAPELNAPSGIALVVSTSGSTGRPRNVALSADALHASARATHEFLGANDGDRWSLRLPLTHIAGAMVLVRSLELGSVPITERAPGGAYFDAIVPTQLHRATTRDLELCISLQSARAVLVGGAAISEELLAESKKLGINVVTTYGMSETAGGCVYNNQALRGVKIRLHTDSRIEISGPMLASGYLGNDGQLSQTDAFQDGWFTTSDLGEIAPNNQLHVLGRSDDVVVTGGMKVALLKVESIIRTIPGVTDVLCAVAPDDEWGQRIVAGIVGDSAIGLVELRDYVGQRIGRFAAPRAIVRLKEIPVRGIGKPDRGALSTMRTDEEM
jgi:O-succinylbenzoic acid--CoA ligase